jgi:hypothetical protein
MARSCYANSLGNCLGALSLEHYLSHGVIAVVDEWLLVSGLSHRPLQARLPARDLGAKVLCKKHNSALSVLDAEAVKFTSALMAFHRGQLSTRIDISGDLLERWCLKVLCGFLASGHVSLRSGGSHRQQPPAHWVRLLFGLDAFPSDRGLHFIDLPPEDKNREPFELTVTTTDGSPHGIRITLLGLNLFLQLGPLAPGPSCRPIYRPRAFFMDDELHSIFLNWSGVHTQRAIVVDRG